jgi:glycosyltransferase involved in cell wall biosynthesis
MPMQSGETDSEAAGLSTVILTRQIGHYHDARFRAAAARLGNLSVLSLANEGGFGHFLARDPGGYSIDRLFPDRKAYESAVKSGELFGAVGKALARLAAETVVVSGWAAPESFAAIRWARHNRVPLVIMSESQADDAVRSRFREALKSRIVASCDAALVGGPPHFDYMAALGLPPARIHLGYDVVDNEYFARNADVARRSADHFRTEYGLPDRYILASARFIAKKNLPALVEAFAIAAHGTASAPDLVILGDGEERGAIEKAIERTGTGEHVHLPGFIPYDALPIYYGLAEAFAHVSLVEQWGLVVNEAMAAGLSVIVARHNGVARTVVEDGENGFLIDPRSVPDIAAALSRMFAMGPAERSAMGAKGRQAIANWGPARFGAGLRLAIRDAHAAPCKGRLHAWDRWLLDRLAGKLIQKVA